MKKTITLCFLLLSVILKAQPKQADAAEILQALKKLNTVGSVLFIAAHPDDENTRLLAYLAKEKNLRTGYLSITRGDGGQNLVGKEQGDLLGLIRTQELLAARRTDGAEQFFTRANDFGYSKTPEETIAFWNRDSVLNDVVWIIRNFKPDIIISRFPTTGEGGHGHHTASAILASEAFEAAADPKQFTHQLKYTQVWQAKRLFWNTFNFGSTNTTSPDQIQVDVGLFNPLLGKSYGEIAAESRTMHKSQGFGTAMARGSIIEYFKQLKGDSVKTLFQGIDQTWNRMHEGNGVETLISACIQNYNPQSPEKIIQYLCLVHKQISNLKEGNGEISQWKKIKLKETEDLIIACSGLWMEATSDKYIGIPGKEVSIIAQIVNRNNSAVKLNKINFYQSDTILKGVTLKQNEMLTFKRNETLNANAPFSNPYWLNEKHDIGSFRVANPLLIGKPENGDRPSVVFDIEINGINLLISRELTYKHTDPVKGEVYRPFEVLPPATVNISEKVFMFSDGNPRAIYFTIKANTAKVEGTLDLKLSDGWNLQLKNDKFSLAEKGDEIVLEASINPTGKLTEGKLFATLLINEGKTIKSYNKSITRIEYDHIPYQFVLSDAESKLVVVDLKKDKINIGYIPGAGDEVQACLKQAGYKITTLTDDVLANEDLSQYSAILTGIRAYNTNERLQTFYPKLMDYIKQGGNLVVQYNTNNRIGPVVAKIAPYPLTISRDRVTDETAEIRILKPEHAAFNFPNKITDKDFEGWVQERGIYFAGDRDPVFQSLLSANDPNDKALDGSLVVAPHGKGNFVYTGLVFFRQLPAGVPGAYRLLANLLSLPRNE